MGSVVKDCSYSKLDHLLVYTLVLDSGLKMGYLLNYTLVLGSGLELECDKGFVSLASYVSGS